MHEKRRFGANAAIQYFGQRNNVRSGTKVRTSIIDAARKTAVGQNFVLRVLSDKRACSMSTLILQPPPQCDCYHLESS